MRSALLLFRVLCVLALVVASVLLDPPLAAQTNGAIDGSVIGSDGEPVRDADVEIVDLHRRTRVADDGTFQFDDVPPGQHIVVVDSVRGGATARDVIVEAGETITLELGLDLTVHRDEIVVSAAPTAQRRLTVATPTNVVDSQELAKRAAPSLGSTLAGETGVNESYFAAGASRPIVRGLQSDRVRMLENGVGTGDLSDSSPDHAVSAESLTAERVEILRGPATLLYGSSAIGGAVNVIDETIPSHTAVSPFGGTVDLRLGSVADERTGAAVFSGGGSRWAWSLSGLARETDDYEIPGFARLDDDHDEEEGDDHDDHDDEEEENPFGVLPNSSTETSQVAAGASYFFGPEGRSGFVGVSVSGFESNYGIPSGAHEHGEEEEHGEDDHDEDDHDEEAGGIRLDLERVRYDLKAAVTRPFGWFDGMKLRLGVTDYEHDEIEPNGEIGTHFENDQWEGRVEMVQKRAGRLSGAFGVQGGRRDYLAEGEEAFLPPSVTDDLGVFAFEELSWSSLSLQFGARWATRDVSVDDPALPARDFDGLSASLGAVWNPGHHSALGVTLARSVKFPVPEELYAFGEHAATQTFEIGDPSLGDETSLGVDLFYRHETERFRGNVTVFVNDFNEFIYPRFTGVEEDGLQVVEYTQADAEFVGAEVDLGFGLVDTDRLHLDLDLMGDLVRAELADGSSVPRIPPMRLGAGLDLRAGAWTAGAEVRWVDDQTDVADNETPTDGYTALNALVGYRFVTDRVVYDLRLRGTNLTDEEIRLHTSYTKAFAPLPGRDLNLSLRLSF